MIQQGNPHTASSTVTSFLSQAHNLIVLKIDTLHNLNAWKRVQTRIYYASHTRLALPSKLFSGENINKYQTQQLKRVHVQCYIKPKIALYCCFISCLQQWPLTNMGPKAPSLQMGLGPFPQKVCKTEASLVYLPQFSADTFNVSITFRRTLKQIKTANIKTICCANTSWIVFDSNV